MGRINMAEKDKKARIFKVFNYKGFSLDELKVMPLTEFAKIIESKNRRHLLRGINKYENELLLQVDAFHKAKEAGQEPGPIKAMERTMIIVPSMAGVSIAVHCGNGFFPLDIKNEMIGKKLKDYVPTRAHCSHGRPGVGASTASKFVPLK